jgi:hypothetical protein
MQPALPSSDRGLNCVAAVQVALTKAVGALSAARISGVRNIKRLARFKLEHQIHTSFRYLVFVAQTTDVVLVSNYLKLFATFVVLTKTRFRYSGLRFPLAKATLVFLF